MNSYDAGGGFGSFLLDVGSLLGSFPHWFLGARVVTHTLASTSPNLVLLIRFFFLSLALLVPPFFLAAPMESGPSDGSTSLSDSGSGGGDVEFYPLAPRVTAMLVKAHDLGGAALASVSEDDTAAREAETAALAALVANGYHALDAVLFGGGGGGGGGGGAGRKAGLEVRVGAGQAAPGGGGQGPAVTGAAAAVRRLSVTDNGAGMTRGDLINNLSSLGRIDDKALSKAMGKTLAAAAAGLQLPSGVCDRVARELGFFAGYLLATRVVVATKHHDDEPYLWEFGLRSAPVGAASVAAVGEVADATAAVTTGGGHGGGSGGGGGGGDGGFDAGFVIFKGAAALKRGKEVLAAAPAVPGTTPEAAAAGNAAGCFAAGATGDAAGFPRGTTVHLFLRPGALAASASAGGAASPAAASAASAVDESRVRGAAGGWVDAGVSVGAAYPLLFWTDRGSSDARDSAGFKVGEAMGAPGEAVAAQGEAAGRSATKKSAGSGCGGGGGGGGGVAVEDDGSDDYSDAELDAMMDGAPEAALRSASSSSAGAAAGPGGLPILASDFRERAKYVPLRLSYEDRKVLRLAEASLTVSAYTDAVDSVSFADPKMAARRTAKQVRVPRCVCEPGVKANRRCDGGCAVIHEYVSLAS